MTSITIDKEGERYVLTGDTAALISNSRSKFSLRKLNSTSKEGKIVIPFEHNQSIYTLSRIVDLLDRFDFSHKLTESVKLEESSYSRELENFSSFANLARLIRNDDFDSNDELLDGFAAFKDALSNKMKRKLYPLQLLSAYHMAFSQNVCNFSVPGSGKTSIVYGAYAYLNSLPEGNTKFVDKIFVVGPLSSFAPWENEFASCFGREIRSQRLSGDPSYRSEDKEAALYSANPTELTLISFQGAANLSDALVHFMKKNRVLLVADEAHNIKNAEGVWGKAIVKIAEEAKARIILTGTPIPNGYEDLYNLFRFIYPFKHKEILDISYGQLKELTQSDVPPENTRVREFTDRIKPFFIRIKKDDLKLPATKEEVIFVEMDNRQRKIYNFIEKKYIKQFIINSSGTEFDIFNKARLLRLRQAATDPSLLLIALRNTLEHSVYGSDPNHDILDTYDEVIDDVAVFEKVKDFATTHIPQKFVCIRQLLENKVLQHDEKAIIWTIFINNAKKLRGYLSEYGITSQLLIGEIEQTEREVTISKFNDPNNDDFRVIIANPFSVSESISLHKGCHNAIYLERDYNAANFIQSKDRIHRVGLPQDTLTYYYYIVSTDSIDTAIDERLKMKIARMESIINEEIPLFARIDDADETDIIVQLIDDYEKRTDTVQ